MYVGDDEEYREQSAQGYAIPLSHIEFSVPVFAKPFFLRLQLEA